MKRFGIWPFYSEECQAEVCDLIGKGGTLSKYRANREFGSGPQEGSQAWRLEREIERTFHVLHAVVCNSGTAALHMALAALDLKGGEVVVPPFTFSATVAAILHAGGRPVFADVDPFAYCITKETVKRVITKRTKALLPVSLFGRAVDVRGLADFGLPVIEDACQAVGARVGGVYAGTGGLAGAFSFNGCKNLPAGEGGCLVTNDSRLAERARFLGNHAENFDREWIGFNYRMTEVEACIARHGLRALHERNSVRRYLAGQLSSDLWHSNADHKGLCWTSCQADREAEPNDVFYVWPFLLLKGNRGKFIARLEKAGLKGWISGGYITPPLHHYKAFRKYARRALPAVDDLSFKTLCLLSCVRPPATDKDMRFVADCIEEALR